MTRLHFYPGNWLHGKDERLECRESSKISKPLWSATFHF